MDPFQTSLLLILLMFVLLGLGIWIAVTLFMVALLAIWLFAPVAPGIISATTIWGQSSSWALTALPMFIWMGEILFRTQVSADMFRGLAPWTTAIPGGLLHVNVLGSGIFAAICGSSTATAATIGRINLPELAKRGYDERMAYGSLAGAGTLGILIPPSIAMIIYGFLTDVSIAKLFAAGFLPGLMLVVLFSGYIVIWALFNQAKMPKPEVPPGIAARLYESRRLIPVLILIVVVLGSIYGGVATATEAAVIGVAGSLTLSALYGSLTWRSFLDSLYGAMIVSCMISLILASSAVLTTAMGYSGLPRNLANWIAAMNLSPYVLLMVLSVFFIILGCFIDGLSILVLTASIIVPIVEKAGIDLLWFGIYLVIMIEIGLVTPPVGFNLFVIQGLTGREITFISRGAVPFFLLLILGTVIITIFPEIVWFLPRYVRL
ncbi:MAG: TRAP transporter large permease subunit [Alphaproteobacteria bacterium]|nr:TRAP transporter large permease subunit [Alphaproteobacteria bacterium]